MNTLILSLLKNRADADIATDALLENGVSSKDISIIIKSKKWAHEASKSTAQTASAAMARGFIGGVAGLLAGMGAMALPGIGAVLMGGPVVTALGISGAAVAAASTITGSITGITGGLVGGFVGLGLSESEARAYEDAIRDGAVLYGIKLYGEKEELVKKILAENGARDIKTLQVERFLRANLHGMSTKIAT